MQHYTIGIGIALFLIIVIQIGRIIQRRKPHEPVAPEPVAPELIVKSVTVESNGERIYTSCNEFGLIWQTDVRKGQQFVDIRQLRSHNRNDWYALAALMNYSIVEVEWVKVEEPQVAACEPENDQTTTEG